MVFIQLCIFSR
jgi:hypothetical protein